MNLVILLIPKCIFFIVFPIFDDLLFQERKKKKRIRIGFGTYYSLLKG